MQSSLNSGHFAYSVHICSSLGALFATLLAATILSSPAHADCPTAPLTSTDDMVVSFLAAQGGTQAAPSIMFSSTVKEGMLVYDDTANALKVCNGTAWQTLDVAGSAGSAAGTVAGAVQFRSSTGAFAADDANFVWDDMNNRLGIGIATPTFPLNVAGTTRVQNASGTIATDITHTSVSASSFLALNAATSYLLLSSATNNILNRAGGYVTFENQSGTEFVRITSAGSMGIGTNAPNASSLLDVSSTTKGFLPPRMTTAQRDAIATPAAGLQIYNTSTNQPNYFNGTTWTVTGTGAGGLPAGANTQIQFNASGAFGADSNLVWDNTNKRLGIGVASPTMRLHVQDTDGTGIRIGGSASNYFDANYNVFRSTTQVETMRIAPDGSVGIGTATPNNKLSVMGAMVVSDTSATVAAGGWLQRLYSTTNTNTQSLYYQANDPNAATQAFQKFRGSGNELLPDDDIGRIDFYGVAASNSTSYRAASILAEAESGWTGANDSPGRLTFWTAPDGSGSAVERVRITRAGQVGIGTTNPGANLGLTGLHVANASAGYANIRASGPTGDNNWAGGIEFMSDNGTSVNTKINASTLGLFFHFGGTERMRISASGNVGIGATPDVSAILDASSTSKGFLPPRMTTAQRDAIGTPATGLEIFNTTTNQPNYYNGSAWIVTGAGAPPAAIGADKQIIFNDAGTLAGNSGLIFDKTIGGLGVGLAPTTTYPFHFYKNQNAPTTLRVQNNNVGSSAFARMFLSADAAQLAIDAYSSTAAGSWGGVPYASRAFIGGGTGLAGLIFSAHDTGAYMTWHTGSNAERMRLDSSGNLGIGAASPRGRLNVYGTGQTTANIDTTSGDLSNMLILQSSNIAAGDGGGVVFGMRTVGGSTDGLWAAIKGLAVSGSNYSAGDLAFSTRSINTDATLTEKLRIKADGNIGIGTSTPAHLLTLKSSAVTRQLFEAPNTSTRFAHFDGGTGGDGVFDISPISATATDSSLVRLFRETNVTGSAGLAVLRANNTASINSFISANADSYLNAAVGNVGLGTTTPSQKLDVAGNIALSTGGFIYGDTTNAFVRLNNAIGAVLQYGSGPTTSQVRAGGPVIIVTGNVERFRVHTTGDVGIGTVTPYSLLHVANTGYAQFEKMSLGAPPSVDCDAANETGRVVYDSTNNLWYVCEGTGGWVNASGTGGGSSAGTAGYIQVSGGSGTFASSGATAGEQFFWDNTNKRLGIGTAVPATPLEVVKEGEIARLSRNSLQYLSYSSASGGHALTFQSADYAAKNLVFNVTTDATNTAPSSGTNNIYFQTRGANRLFIGDNGNVGVGTASPNAQLQLGNLTDPSPSNMNKIIFWEDTVTTPRQFGIGISAAQQNYKADNHVFFTSANNATTQERMRITSTGSVGIGTVSPSERLSVIGNIAASSATASAIISANTSLSGAVAQMFFGNTGAGGTNWALNAGNTATGGGLGANFGLAEGSNYRLVVAQGGNVGIGTTSPITKLDIGAVDGTNEGGEIHLRGAGAYRDWWMDQYQDDFRIFSTNQGSGAGYAERFRIDDTTGNVGVGTTGPTSKLHVNGTGGNGGGALFQSDTWNSIKIKGVNGAGVNDSAFLQFEDAALENTFIGLVGTAGQGSGNVGDLRFGVGGAERLRISKTTGNVGVGITPAHALDVYRTGANNAYVAVRADLAQQAGMLFLDNTNGTDWHLYRVDGTRDIAFWNPTVGTVMRMNQAGRVGIGASTPSYKLEVLDTVAGSWAGRVYNGSADANAHGFFAQTAGTSGVALMGQNTSTNAYTYLGYGGYGIYCGAGTCGGSSAWTPPSDVRLKRDIEPLVEADGLDVIMKLRPVTYHWKDKQQEARLGRQYGFIAQEIEKVLPETVVTTKGMVSTITLENGEKEQIRDPKAMDYGAVVVPLTKAVQQLKAANDNLASENQELRYELRSTISSQDAEIDALRSELHQLRKSLQR